MLLKHKFLGYPGYPTSPVTYGYLGYLNQDLNTHSRWKPIIVHWKETLNAGSGMILPFAKKSVEQCGEQSYTIKYSAYPVVFRLKNRP